MVKQSPTRQVRAAILGDGRCLVFLCSPIRPVAFNATAWCALIEPCQGCWMTEFKTVACLPIQGPNLLFLWIGLERGSLPGAVALPYRLHTSFQSELETTNYFYSGRFGFLGVRIRGLTKYKSMKVCILHQDRILSSSSDCLLCLSCYLQ